jgi:hypothetical protein
MYAAAGGVPRVISNTGDASEYGGKTFYIFSPLTLLLHNILLLGYMLDMMTIEEFFLWMFFEAVMDNKIMKFIILNQNFNHALSI